MSLDNRAVVGWIKKYPTLFVLGVLSLALGFVIYARSGLQESQRNELNRYLAEVTKCRANINNSSQLQQQLDFLIQANAAIKQRSFDPETSALILQYFYKLESDVGVKFTDLRPASKPSLPKGKVIAKGSYVPLNCVVGIQCSFEQAIMFMKHLEQGVFFCRINSASIYGVDGVVTLNLNLDLLGIQ